MGVRISIDDFGTGYSSLAYLSQLPVDALKIDKSFVQGIETQKDKADIVATLTTMAQQLKLHVVVEGIESEEHLAYLRSLHCESAQRYLFAKPLDARAATDLLNTGLPPRPTSAGHQAARPSTSEGRIAALLGRGRPTSARAWLSTAAAALALLIVGGMTAWPTSAVRPPISSEARPVVNSPNKNPAEVPAGPVSREGSDPASRGMGADTTAELAVQERTSGNVVHLHRFGTCQGRVVVSRNGVTFTPEGKSGHEALAFKYGEFLYAVEDNTLTIKSHDGTYRFRAQAAGKTLSGAPLRELAQSIARFATPAATR